MTKAQVLIKIERAIALVCSELSKDKSPPVSWISLNESALFRELCACILGSRVKYEVAEAYASALTKDAALQQVIKDRRHPIVATYIERILATPLVVNGISHRYPFPASRADYIARSAIALCRRRMSLRELLHGSADPYIARQNLVTTVIGVGPKQASLFLRRVGFSSDLAVFDSHSLRYIALKRTQAQVQPPRSLKEYESLEQWLLNIASAFGVTLGHFDLALWITMRQAALEGLV